MFTSLLPLSRDVMNLYLYLYLAQRITSAVRVCFSLSCITELPKLSTVVRVSRAYSTSDSTKKNKRKTIKQYKIHKYTLLLTNVPQWWTNFGCRWTIWIKTINTRGSDYYFFYNTVFEPGPKWLQPNANDKVTPGGSTLAATWTRK